MSNTEKKFSFAKPGGAPSQPVEDIKSTTITKYVREGFTAESAIAAVRAQDISLLKHSGLTSVQLQPPMPNGPPAANGAPGPNGQPALEPTPINFGALR